MSNTTNTSSNCHCSTCRKENLEALYQLNIEAKAYAEAAEDAYYMGRKAMAKRHSERKKALYSLKEHVLQEFVTNGCVTDVEKHVIADREYYCLFINSFSFHTPVEKWDTPEFTVPSTVTELDDFNSDSDSRDDCMSEESALQHLSRVFKSPNTYITTPFVGNTRSPSFVGWDFLPGSVEVGDKVPDHFKKSYAGQDFLFEEGDVFQTTNGECEIIDRYAAWLEPVHTHERQHVLQREAYDVRIDGGVKECVQQQRLIGDWKILVTDTCELLPRVDGKQQELLSEGMESVSFDLCVGDVIEVVSPADGGTVCWEITQMDVSYSAVFCEFEPVTGDNSPPQLAIGDFADKLVSVNPGEQ